MALALQAIGESSPGPTITLQDASGRFELRLEAVSGCAVCEKVASV